MKYILTALVFIIFSSLVIANANKAHACYCAGPSLNQIDKTDIVFLGKAIYVNNSTPYNQITVFEVYKSWKGLDKDMVTISTLPIGAACGYDFIENEEYIVFADKEKATGSYTTGTCQTAEIGYGQEILAKLNELGSPKIFNDKYEPKAKPNYKAEYIGIGGFIAGVLFSLIAINLIKSQRKTYT